MVKKAARKVIGKKAMKKTKGGHYNCSDTARQAGKGAATGRYYDGMGYQER